MKIDIKNINSKDVSCDHTFRSIIYMRTLHDMYNNIIYNRDKSSFTIPTKVNYIYIYIYIYIY